MGTFQVHSWNLVPSCVGLTTAIFDLQKDCYQDEKGNCQTEINARGDKYKRGIIRVLRATRRRRNLTRSKSPRKAEPELGRQAWTNWRGRLTNLLFIYIYKPSLYYRLGFLCLVSWGFLITTGGTNQCKISFENADRTRSWLTQFSNFRCTADGGVRLASC